MKITITSNEAAGIVSQYFKMRGQSVEAVTIEPPSCPLMAILAQARAAERSDEGLSDTINHVIGIARVAEVYIDAIEAKTFIEAVWKLADKD